MEAWKTGIKINMMMTGKHLCWSLFYNKVAWWRLATLSKTRICHMQMLMFSSNVFEESFKTLHLFHDLQTMAIPFSELLLLLLFTANVLVISQIFALNNVIKCLSNSILSL